MSNYPYLGLSLAPWEGGYDHYDACEDSAQKECICLEIEDGYEPRPMPLDSDGYFSDYDYS